MAIYWAPVGTPLPTNAELEQQWVDVGYASDEGIQFDTADPAGVEPGSNVAALFAAALRGGEVGRITGGRIYTNRPNLADAPPQYEATLHEIDETLAAYDHRTTFDAGGGGNGEEWPYAF